MNHNKFISYMSQTLSPDLREAGSTATADDIDTLVGITRLKEALGKLTLGLTLAITAPTDEQSERAVVLSNHLIDSAQYFGATDKDIELCKKAAVCAVEYLNQRA
jgi:hypothetical protein